MDRSWHVAIVGGGITGLATAYYLVRQREGALLRVTLIEADGRLGGKIRTEPFAGMAVDAGPEAFLTRMPWAVALCRELGLEGELVAPVASKTWLWSRGRLRPLPDGLVLGVPTSMAAIVRSGILSPAGIVRAGLDLVLPRCDWPADPSVAQVIGARLGREAVERLVEPILGGIHAGRADRLSLMAVAPHLMMAARQYRSLIWGLRASLPPPGGGASPALLSVKGGLVRLVERLRVALDGCDLRLSTRVTSVARQSDGRYRLACVGGPAIVADAVVLAVPAWVAAGLLYAVTPAIAAELAAISYASVAVVTLGYLPSAFRQPFDGSGFLVPRVDGRLLTACSWLTNKWPDLRRGGIIVLRCSTGRLGDDRAARLEDGELVEQIHRELVAAVGVQERPIAVQVTRWEQMFPQYEVGHQARVARIEAGLAALPGLILAGDAYHGQGIAACIHDGELAATQVQAYLAGRLRAITADVPSSHSRGVLDYGAS